MDKGRTSIKILLCFSCILVSTIIFSALTKIFKINSYEVSISGSYFKLQANNSSYDIWMNFTEIYSNICKMPDSQDNVDNSICDSLTSLSSISSIYIVSSVISLILLLVSISDYLFILFANSLLWYPLKYSQYLMPIIYLIPSVMYLFFLINISNSLLFGFYSILLSSFLSVAVLLLHIYSEKSNVRSSLRLNYNILDQKSRELKKSDFLESEVYIHEENKDKIDEITANYLKTMKRSDKKENSLEKFQIENKEHFKVISETEEGIDQNENFKRKIIESEKEGYKKGFHEAKQELTRYYEEKLKTAQENGYNMGEVHAEAILKEEMQQRIRKIEENYNNSLFNESEKFREKYEKLVEEHQETLKKSLSSNSESILFQYSKETEDLKKKLDISGELSDQKEKNIMDELKNKEEKINNLLEENEKIRNAQGMFRFETENTILTQKNLIENLYTENSKLKNSLSQKENELAQANTRFNSFASQNEDNNRSVLEKNREIQRLNAILQEHEQKLHKNNEEIVILAKNQEKIKELNQVVATLNSSSSENIEKLIFANKRIEEDAKNLEKKEIYIKELSQTVKRQEKKIEDLDKDVKLKEILGEENDKLKSNLLDIERMLDKNIKDCESLKESVKISEKKYEDAKNELVEKIGEIENLKKSLKSLNENAEMLRNNLSEMINENMKLGNEKEKLESENEAHLLKIKHLESKSNDS